MYYTETPQKIIISGRNRYNDIKLFLPYGWKLVDIAVAKFYQ